MDWAEAGRLTLVLLADPSAAVTAAAVGWARPASLESIVLADLIDVQLARSVEHPPRYPRPWERKPTPKRKGPRRTHTQFRQKWAELTGSTPTHIEAGR